MISYAGLALLVMLATATVDYSHARYVKSMLAGHRHRASRWAVAQWTAAAIGFVVAVRVTLWLLPAEAFGVYAGTWLGSGRDARAAPAG